MSRDPDNSEPCSPVPTGQSVRSQGGASGLLLRPVQPDDGEAIHSLLMAGIPDALADQGRWLSRWRWRCWDNPYRRDRPAGWVLVEAGRIVGHLGAVHVPLRVGDETLTGVIGADYVVAAGATERDGIFAGLQLAEAFFLAADDCLAMATTANEKTGAVFSRFGCRPVAWTKEFWRAPATVGQEIRTCRGGASRTARRLLSGFARPVAMGLLGRCYRLLHHRPATPIPAGCRLETTMPALAGDLGWIWEGFVWDGAATGTRDAGGGGSYGRGGEGAPSDGAGVVGIDRTHAYFDWRYARHPERESIRVLVLRDRNGYPIGAAVVLLEDRDGRRVAFVEELITLPHRMEVIRTLLCASLKLAHDYDAGYLVTTTGRRSIRQVFWELGFESRARSAPAVVIQPPQSANAACPGPFLFESLDDHLDFWHGDMF